MFREDFVWGVASSAYQIEGTEVDDGRGQNIWDVFAAEGKILGKQNADISCDHMHHYEEDFALMRLLGVKAYRFSVSWSRIMPEGTGRVNQKAIALYRDMIQSMKKNGITPYLTMYHWEFPQALQNKGGWLNEDSIQWFGEYAKVIAENFSDLVTYFMTLNEPQCFVGLGYHRGVHAPGLKVSLQESFQIAHNVLRAHGQAVINLRKYACCPIQVGYAPTCGVAYPYTDAPEDIEAARQVYFGFENEMENWTWNVAWFSDPVVLGKYPEAGLKKFAKWLPKITKEDMELISQPLDFMGQNIYNGYFIRAGKDGKPEFINRKEGFPKTGTGWPVTPECIYWGLRFMYERYHLPMYITENGMSDLDNIAPDGKVHDSNRIEFLDTYLSQVQRAADEGVDIRGYFLWTFLDNMEWSEGYNERFGIVYVDFATQERIVKDSAYWYQKVMETNGSNLMINKLPKTIMLLADEEQYKITTGIYRGRTLADVWQENPSLFGNEDVNQFTKLTNCTEVAITYEKPVTLEQTHPYMDLHVLEGDGLLEGRLVKKGDHIVIPCGYGEIYMQGNMKVKVLTV